MDMEKVGQGGLDWRIEGGRERRKKEIRSWENWPAYIVDPLAPREHTNCHYERIFGLCKALQVVGSSVDLSASNDTVIDVLQTLECGVEKDCMKMLGCHSNSKGNRSRKLGSPRRVSSRGLGEQQCQRVVASDEAVCRQCKKTLGGLHRRRRACRYQY